MSLFTIYKYSVFIHLIAAIACGVALFVNAYNGVIFVAVIMALFVLLNLFLAYDSFNKMIKEK